MHMRSKLTIRRIIIVLAAICFMASGTVWVVYAVINGQPDNNDHPYVGLVTNFFTGGIDVCSCVAISDTILVTSAHCFEAEETVFQAISKKPK